MLLLLAACSSLGAVPSFPPHLVGTTDAVAALLERVLPGSSAHFALSIAPACPGVANGTNCFTLADSADGAQTVVTGTTASELTGGLGVYFREYCGMTIGWERGGGRHVFTPSPWPRIGQTPVSRPRTVPYSHVTQVCTHSYTLVWHDWGQWQTFIDWMALAGHNSIVAPTGQEEVQYKVLTEQFGVADMDVRNWTNGPAWLTWSRGQNSHGNGIGGPLPRSFMKGQHALQKQILGRYRELGIAGHLPAFGGYAPWSLAIAQNATNRIAQGVKGAYDTAWIDGRDPLFTAVADAWAKEVVSDWDSDHVWQMDAFFGNGSGWGDDGGAPEEVTAASAAAAAAAAPAAPSCTWSAVHANTYLEGCATPAGGASQQVGQCQCVCFDTLADAQAACELTTYPDCSGVTTRGTEGGAVELRTSSTPTAVPARDQETSYVLLNAVACRHPPSPTPTPPTPPTPAPPTPPPSPYPVDPLSAARAQAAYGAIARADGLTARWIFQGWALHVPGSPFAGNRTKALARLHGFSTAAPPGQFILLDMSVSGEFKSWHGTWGIPFIWTTLHDFGGNQGIRGKLSEVNAVPFEAPPLSAAPIGYDPATQAVGVGYTPEGLDQNTAYYELLQEAAFKAAPERNLTAWLVKRAHRRYGLQAAGAGENADVAAAWGELGASGYANNGNVHDGTAVGLLIPEPSWEAWNGFSGSTPKPALCKEYRAWGALLAAAPAVNASAVKAAGATTALPAPFSYDLVDVGREVLSQLTTHLRNDFSAALAGSPATAAAAQLDATLVHATGTAYVALLRDLDALLATDSAFLLGTWLESARRLGGSATDCGDTQLTGGKLNGSCADFMEWNARAQITTWYPTSSPSRLGSGLSPQDNDYARKQWGGLVAGYYAARAALSLEQAEADATAGRLFSAAQVEDAEAKLSYDWQTDFGNVGPTSPVGDPVAVSAQMRAKYVQYFDIC